MCKKTVGRHSGNDYGNYDFTICTRDRKNLLSKIENNGGVGLAPTLIETAKPILTLIGDIVDRYWIETPDHYPNVVLDEYVIMPDHMHGIVLIGDRGGVTPPAMKASKRYKSKRRKTKYPATHKCR